MDTGYLWPVNKGEKNDRGEEIVFASVLIWGHEKNCGGGWKLAPNLARLFSA